MRVLHLHSGNLFGGVETMLLLLARQRALVPEMEPEYALSYGGALREQLAETGVPVHNIGEARVRNPLSLRKARRSLRTLVEHSRPDVVLLHSFWAQAIFGPVLRAASVPFATWVHDLTSGRHWLERWAALSPPALYLASSEFIARNIRALYPSARAQAIHCPVILEAGAAPERSGGAVTIVQVGRLERWKGHEVLLDALASMSDLPEWRCLIVGGAQRPQEGVYLASLRARAESRGIADRVEFLGQRSDIARVLRAADIYCQPNTSPEPFGIAIVEAMLAGLPVITSAMGGALEIVDPASGILVEPGNPKELAAALRQLIASPAARHAAGKRGQERARGLTDAKQQMISIAEALGSATGV